MDISTLTYNLIYIILLPKLFLLWECHRDGSWVPLPVYKMPGGPSYLFSASALQAAIFAFPERVPFIGEGLLEPTIWSQGTPRHWVVCYFCLSFSFFA